MLLHDPSDVFLEVAKACQYLGYELLSMCSFALLVVSWGVLRLGVLPGWLIRSAVYVLHPVSQHDPSRLAFAAARDL